MNDFLASLPFIEDYHKLWIKYFTMDYKLASLKSNQKTEVDFFLDGFNYSPLSFQTIKKELLTCKTTEEVTNKLVSLFKFDEYLVLNSCLLAQICVSNPSTKSENISLVPQFVFRGFLVFCYYLPNGILSSLNNSQFPQFQEQYWGAANYMIEYIFLCKNDIINDLAIAFDPLRSTLLQIKQIYSLPKNHKVYLFLKKLMETVVPFLHSFVLWNNWTFFEFCNDVFNLWSSCNNDISHTDPLIEVVLIFFQTVSSFISDIPKQISSKLAIFAACFISRFCTSTIDPIPQDIYFCLTCFTLISKAPILDNNNDSTILVVRSLSTFLRWALISTPIDEEFTNLYYFV